MSGHARNPNALHDLAHGIRRLAHSEVVNHGTHIERWRVLQGKPLLIEEVEGDLVLEEGDPDFTIGDPLRQHIATYGLAKDDQVLVTKAGHEWHAFDAASNTTPAKPGTPLKAGTYTITGDTPLRVFNPTTVTLPQLANVVATLIRDLGGG